MALATSWVPSPIVIVESPRRTELASSDVPLAIESSRQRKTACHRKSRWFQSPPDSARRLGRNWPARWQSADFPLQDQATILVQTHRIQRVVLALNSRPWENR